MHQAVCRFLVSQILQSDQGIEQVKPDGRYLLHPTLFLSIVGVGNYLTSIRLGTSMPLRHELSSYPLDLRAL